MLESSEVDVVYISLPNHLHAEWTIKALQAGVHVLCEKPFAISLAEVDAVIHASQESGITVTEALMYRHHPQTRIVQDLVRDGKLGQITAMRGVFTFLFGEEARSPGSLNVRMVPEYGGGCLWDIGIYPLSYAQNLFGGLPDWVIGSQVVGPTDIDEVFTGQMGYSGRNGKEILVQICSSFNSPYHTRIEITGREGRLEITRPFGNIDRKAKVLLTDKKGRTRKLSIPRKSLYLGEVEDLESAILDGKEQLISLQETRNHVITLLALYHSARTGQTVQLQEFTQGR
jgi:predicted dehydrogenase